MCKFLFIYMNLLREYEERKIRPLEQEQANRRGMGFM